MAGKIDDRTLWNIAAIVALCVIALAIVVFVGRALTMNSPGNNAPVAMPSLAPGDGANVITLPSKYPTVMPSQHPTSSITPTASPGASTTPTPSATVTPTPTAQPSASPAPTPTPTPTATPSPLPSSFGIWESGEFYEDISELKDIGLPHADNTYLSGNGPLYLDFEHSNFGSMYAYLGDTIGVSLKMKNLGPAIDRDALVTMNLSRVYGPIEFDDVIHQQTATRIKVGENGSFVKNFCCTIPDMPDLPGFYRIYIRFYLDGNFNCGFIKEINILAP